MCVMWRLRVKTGKKKKKEGKEIVCLRVISTSEKNGFACEIVE